MTRRELLHRITFIALWAITVGAVAYIGLALYGAREVKAEETNTLVCSPASPTSNYALPTATAWRLAETSQVGDNSWAGHYVGQTMITEGNDQYVVYYNADRRITIGYRTLGASTWQRYSIPGDDAVVGWDSHNYLTGAIDKNGNLHVSGNLHGQAMRYWKTTTPRQITSIQRVETLVNASDETGVTYPQFMKDNNGDLVFNYRNGYSGSGKVYFNKYDAITNSWSALLQTNLFDGQSGTPDRSAYFSLTSTPNADGFYEMTWMWRDTGDVATNSRLSYARTSDLQTWEAVDGTELTLPFTYDSPNVVIDDVPEGGGLFNNQERIGVDAEGRPTVTYSKYDTFGSNQIYVARPNAQGIWQTTRITNWTGAWVFYGFGSVPARISVNATVVTASGDLRFGFSCGGSTPGSGTIILDNTTLFPIAQTGSYSPDTYPSSVLQTTATTPASAARRVTNIVNDNGDQIRYIMKWQSQGVNQDTAFAEWPDAQPLIVYTLLPYSAADAPSNLMVTFEPDNTNARLAWNAPSDTGGYPITDYLIEYSPDNGENWTTFAHAATNATSATIPGLTPGAQYSFRVSPVTTYGVGNAIVNMAIVPDEQGASTPEIPQTITEAAPSVPDVPNTGSLLPNSVHPLAILLLGVSSSALILLSTYRRSTRE